MATRKKDETTASVLASILKQNKDQTRADIQKWRNALRMAGKTENPSQFVLQDLYDNLEHDGHLLSQVNLRKAATVAYDFAVYDRKTGEADEEKTEFLKSEWFYGIINHLLDGIFKGATYVELVDPVNLTWEIIPRRNIVPGYPAVYLQQGTDSTLYFGDKKDRIIHSHIGTLGLYGDIAGMLIWKRNAMQSWAEFTERFGFPLITAITNKTKATEIAAINEQLRELGQSANAVLPEGTSIDIKPFTGGDSYNVFAKQIDVLNQEISKTIVGGTMLSDEGSSRSQAEVHERNLDDKIAISDRRMIAWTVNRQLFYVLNRFGYDFDPAKYIFQWEDSFELSLKEHWEIVNKMIDVAEIPAEWLSKTFNIPIERMRDTPLSRSLQTEPFAAAKATGVSRPFAGGVEFDPFG